MMFRSVPARVLSRGLAAVGAASCLLAAASATLAPVAGAATEASTAARPACVSVRHTAGNITQTVYVTNNCSRTVSFVVHRVGPDSPCLHVSPHHWRSYKWANGLNYQGTTFGCD
jgi:hypothetical protein